VSELLDQEWQRHIASMADHWAMHAKESIAMAASEAMRPCVLYRPKLSIDGDKWCALYGENLQDGVAGFGNSPAEAMHDFDAAWIAPLGKGAPP